MTPADSTRQTYRGAWPGGVNETLYRLRRAAIAASHGETELNTPDPRNPNEAEAEYIAAAESFRAGRQCAGWDHFEAAEAIIGGAS